MHCSVAPRCSSQMFWVAPGLVCAPQAAKTPRCGMLWTQSDLEVTKSWRKKRLKVTKCKDASGSGDPRNWSLDRIWGLCPSTLVLLLHDISSGVCYA